MRIEIIVACGRRIERNFIALEFLIYLSKYLFYLYVEYQELVSEDSEVSDVSEFSFRSDFEEFPAHLSIEPPLVASWKRFMYETKCPKIVVKIRVILFINPFTQLPR